MVRGVREAGRRIYIATHPPRVQNKRGTARVFYLFILFNYFSYLFIYF